MRGTVRGQLTLTETKPKGWTPTRLMASLLVPGEPKQVLPPLDQARVARLDERGMLIVGDEQLGTYSNDLERYRQAWWCLPWSGGST